MFASIVQNLIEQEKIAQEQEKQQKEAEEQKAKDEAIALLRRELAHLLDDSWKCQCNEPPNPFASCEIGIEGVGVYSISLMRDACDPTNQIAKYLPELHEIDQGGQLFSLAKSDWVLATALNQDVLAKFVTKEICKHRNIKTKDSEESE